MTHRATWDNSPELRESVRRDLEQWGKAQRGGMPDLGYPHEQPFSVSPGPATPTFDPELVQAITDSLTLWRLTLRSMPNDDRKAKLLQLLVALKQHYITDKPAEANAKIFGVSRRTFWRWVDDATFRFWVLHY